MENTSMKECIDTLRNDIQLVAAEAVANAKSQFVANMNHEIRVPLNAKLGINDFELRNISELPDENYLVFNATESLSLD